MAILKYSFDCSSETDLSWNGSRNTSSRKGTSDKTIFCGSSERNCEISVEPHLDTWKINAVGLILWSCSHHGANCSNELTDLNIGWFSADALQSRIVSSKKGSTNFLLPTNNHRQSKLFSSDMILMGSQRSKSSSFREIKIRGIVHIRNLSLCRRPGRSNSKVA